jgi:RHS repeat-associated protein
VIAISNGTTNTIQKYDEYGNRQSTNAAISAGGRFGYTGQTWLPELSLWYYKARVYNPILGRFMQSDPIVYGDGMNIYSYVKGDPVNFSDGNGQCRFTVYAHFRQYWNEEKQAYGPKIFVGTSVEQDSPCSSPALGQLAVDFLSGLENLAAEGDAEKRCPVDMPPARYGSPFGPRKSPTAGASTIHNGQDLPQPVGSRVYAPEGGVVRSFFHKTGGDSVTVTVNANLRYGFGHTAFNTELTNGQRVSAGDIIGFTNMSGASTGPHLHFTITVNGQKINPISFLKAVCK